MSPPSLRRYRAERLLRSEFVGRRTKVLAIVRSQLRAKGITLDPADLEACYAQAWQGLYTAVLGGEEVENPSAWLVLVTFRRAIDESRSAARHQLIGDTGRAVFNPDLAGALDDRVRLRHVLEGLRSRLSGRECEAASLCYLQGLSRAEAAARMGISDARMRKLMEGTGPSRPGVAGKVSELVSTIKQGGWCEQQSSLMRAFAFGVLDPGGERHALAMAHCRECPACRLHVASLRGLAAVLPPLPLHLVLGGGAGLVAGAGTGAAVSGTAGPGAAPAGLGTAPVGPGTASVGSGTASVGSGTASVGSGTAPVGLGTAPVGLGTAPVGLGTAGSLTAKLAVTGLVVLGAGYAVLGGHARGSQPTHHAPLVSPSIAGDTLSQAPPVARFGSVGTKKRTSPHPSEQRMPTPGGTRSAGEAAAREFGPEWAKHGHSIQAPRRSVRRSTRATGEFGIE